MCALQWSPEAPGGKMQGEAGWSEGLAWLVLTRRRSCCVGKGSRTKPRGPGWQGEPSPGHLCAGLLYGSAFSGHPVPASSMMQGHCLACYGGSRGPTSLCPSVAPSQPQTHFQPLAENQPFLGHWVPFILPCKSSPGAMGPPTSSPSFWGSRPLSPSPREELQTPTGAASPWTLGPPFIAPLPEADSSSQPWGKGLPWWLGGCVSLGQGERRNEQVGMTNGGVRERGKVQG